MSEKIKREDRKFKFETLQLTRRPGTAQTQSQMQEQYRFTRHHHTYSTTATMQQHVSDLQMQVTFMDV